jgi:hypothetical protein
MTDNDRRVAATTACRLQPGALAHRSRRPPRSLLAQREPGLANLGWAPEVNGDAVAHTVQPKGHGARAGSPRHGEPGRIATHPRRAADPVADAVLSARDGVDTGSDQLRSPHLLGAAASLYKAHCIDNNVSAPTQTTDPHAPWPNDAQSPGGRPAEHQQHASPGQEQAEPTECESHTNELGGKPDTNPPNAVLGSRHHIRPRPTH